MSDAPRITVWKPVGNRWRRVGPVGAYDDLSFEPRYNAAGQWSITLPFDEQALRIARERLVTIDWRGSRTTWTVTQYDPRQDEFGDLVLEVSGAGALSLLARIDAWPAPTTALASQPFEGVLTGPTETVLLRMVRENAVTRYGMKLTVPASAGRGQTITVRPRFDNLLDLVTTKATVDRLAVDVGLVDTEPGWATLQLSVRTPVDRTKRVRLTERVGSLAGWTNTAAAPVSTVVVVAAEISSDVENAPSTWIYRRVTTPQSEAAAAAWGGHREVFVDGPSSTDTAELDQAGVEQLLNDAAVETLQLVAAEAEGLRAFEHYNVGDLATGEVLPGQAVTDIITAIGVEIGDDGTTITPTFGDPDATEPLASLASMLVALRREVQALRRRSA